MQENPLNESSWPGIKRKLEGVINLVDVKLSPRKRRKRSPQTSNSLPATDQASESQDTSLPASAIEVSQSPTDDIDFEELVRGEIPSRLHDQSREFGFVHLRTNTPGFDQHRINTDIPSNIVGWGQRVTTGPGCPVNLQIEPTVDLDGCEIAHIPNMTDEPTWPVPATQDASSWSIQLTELMESLNGTMMDCFQYDGEEEATRQAIGISPSALACDSLLRRTRTQRMGIHTPMIHLTPKCSLFPAQKEHCGLSSLHLLHAGCSKVSIIIKPHHSRRFEERFDADQIPCSQWIRHLGLVPSPASLEQARIDYSIIIQKAGELLYISGDAYHFSFNLGPNCVEIINACPDQLWRVPDTYVFCTHETCGAGYLEKDDLSISESPLFCSPGDTRQWSISEVDLPVNTLDDDSPAPFIDGEPNASMPSAHSAPRVDGLTMLLTSSADANSDTEPILGYGPSGQWPGMPQACYSASTSIHSPVLFSAHPNASSENYDAHQSNASLPLTREAGNRHGYPTPPLERSIMNLDLDPRIDTLCMSDRWKSCIKRSAEAAGFHADQVCSILKMWERRPNKGISYILRCIQLVCEIAAPKTLRRLKDALVDLRAFQTLKQREPTSKLDGVVIRCIEIDTMQTTHAVSNIFSQRLLLLGIWKDFKELAVETDPGLAFAMNDNFTSQKCFKTVVHEIMEKNPKKAKSVEGNFKRHLLSGRALSSYIDHLDPMLFLLFPGYEGHPLVLKVLDPPEEIEDFVKQPFHRSER